VRSVILVPTLDLSHQVEKVLLDLMSFCPKELKVVNLANEDSQVFQKSLLGTGSSILVSTPSRVLPFLNNKVCFNGYLYLFIRYLVFKSKITRNLGR
jgi:ATP-dependent RNA helicase DDX56/DBP9